jgi:hypothetical protein
MIRRLFTILSAVSLLLFGCRDNGIPPAPPGRGQRPPALGRVVTEIWTDHLPASDASGLWPIRRVRGGGHLEPWAVTTVYGDGSYDRCVWTSWTDRTQQVVTTGWLPPPVFRSFCGDVKRFDRTTVVGGVPTFRQGDTGAASPPTPSGVQAVNDYFRERT